MEKPNKDSLYRATLFVLRRCCETTATHVDIAVAELQDGGSVDLAPAFADAVEFLQRLGVITYDRLDRHTGIARGIELTASGKRLLNSQPMGVMHSSLGERIVAVSRSGSIRAIEETMSILVRTIAAGGMVAALALAG